METIIPEKNIVILKPKISLKEINQITNKKKTSLFGTPLTRPKSEQVQIASTDLFFEPIWKIVGEYNVDFYRKNTHQISVDSHVKEIIIGKGVFPVITDSGTWKKFKDSMKIRKQNNKLELQVEEHVEINSESELCFNLQGKEIEFKVKIKSNDIENLSDEVIKLNKDKMRPSELNENEIIGVFLSLMKNELGELIRIVNENLVVSVFEEIFLPVYEIRLVDAKNRIKILRIDGMNSKIL